MILNLTWPFVPATVGGVELLARRVEESQARGNLANFAMVQVGRRQKVRAEFFREGLYVNLEFAGTGLNGLALVSADVRANRRGKRLWITLAKARHTGGRVGVAYDHDRGYMVAFNREGEAETIALPFSKSDIREVPLKAKQIHHMSSCTLANRRNNMWNETEQSSNYEGIFARQPEKIEDTLWGSRETHTNGLGPDTVVTKNWFGTVQSTETSWYNS